MIDEKIFATPRKVEDVADCYFYHTMELPGRGVIEGRDWDLRGRVDEYSGQRRFCRSTRFGNRSRQRLS